MHKSKKKEALIIMDQMFFAVLNEHILYNLLLLLSITIDIQIHVLISDQRVDCGSKYYYLKGNGIQKIELLETQIIAQSQQNGVYQISILHRKTMVHK